MCRPAGSARASSATRLLDAGLDLEDVGADLLRDADAGGVAAVAGDERRAIGRAREHLGDVLDAQDVRRAGPTTGVWPIAVDRRPQPRGEHQLLHSARRSSARPAASWLAAFSRSATSCTVSPAASSRAGSATTSISRVSLDSDLDLADTGDARQRAGA